MYYVLYILLFCSHFMLRPGQRAALTGYAINVVEKKVNEKSTSINPDDIH